MPDGSPDPHAAAFEALRARFRAGLPARWQQIAEAPDLAQQAAAVHRLAGAAGSYGLDALDASARTALRLMDSAAPADQVAAALEHLREAIAAAARA